MEFICGGMSLASEHQRRPFDIFELRDIDRQLLHTLSYLHENRITHRDLKPANVLLLYRHPIYIKVTDFGVASKSDSLRTFCGTDLYVAPEVRAGKRYGNKVDIWSVGIITLELSIGLPQYPRMHDEWPGVLYDYLGVTDPSLVVSFIRNLLQVDPDIRPSATRSLDNAFFHLELGPIQAAIGGSIIDQPTQVFAPLLSEGEPPNLFTTSTGKGKAKEKGQAKAIP
jgi:serine/threonine protein kinase